MATIKGDRSIFYEKNRQRRVAQLDWGTDPATGGRRRAKKIAASGTA